MSHPADIDLLAQPARWSLHAQLVAACAVMAFPIVWVVVTSLKTPAELYTVSVLPSRLSLANYTAALDAFPLLRLLANTALVAALTAGGQLVLSLLAAHAVTRYRFRGRSLLFAALVGSILVPAHALMVPNYLLVARLGWLNTYAGLVVPQLATAAAGIFLLRQHLREFPRELLEAAEMDGATDLQLLTRVVIPALRPVLAALGIILFIQTWNEYLWPLLVTDGVDRTTVQVGLTAFRSEQGSAWGPMLAAATMASAPLLLLYAVAQRHIISAFLRAGVR